MMGGWAGAHHTEKQVLKIDDTAQPADEDVSARRRFEHTDEFYIFPTYSPYSREKQHVLLSIDVEQIGSRDGESLLPRAARGPIRTTAWRGSRTYGKGRDVLHAARPHDASSTPIPRWTKHVLAAMQYILGDLDADATPSAEVSARRRKSQADRCVGQSSSRLAVAAAGRALRRRQTAPTPPGATTAGQPTPCSTRRSSRSTGEREASSNWRGRYRAGSQRALRLQSTDRRR